MSGSAAPPGHPSRLNQPQQEHEKATVSALMSTYAGETATNLKESLESIYVQTVSPDQLVLVLDGPVDVGQEEVIARYAFDSRVANLTLIRLPSNGGLARAMNAGLERCSGKYIMRADSDDICDPQRLELQLDYFRAHAETDLVAGWCAEFHDDGRPERWKTSSVHHDAVARALRWRNVLTHGTVLIRREKLRGIGGYRPDFAMLEDYDLYVRLVLSGARFHVIPKVLYRMRTSVEQCRRRGGLRYCLNEIRFRSSCLRLGFLNTTEFVVVTLIYVVFRLIGVSCRDRLYAFVRAPPVEYTGTALPSAATAVTLRNGLL
jgi:glycosyltransferase involved in cell wall biosynthesis